MGEIAEQMLDGTLCACCGDYLGFESGVPILCYTCAQEQELPPIVRRPNTKVKVKNLMAEELRKPLTAKFNCPYCPNKLKPAIDSLTHHLIARHGLVKEVDKEKARLLGAGIYFLYRDTLKPISNTEKL